MDKQTYTMTARKILEIIISTSEKRKCTKIRLAIAEIAVIDTLNY